MSIEKALKNLESPVALYDHQKTHVDSIWRSLTQNGELSYIDTSRTGLGKTHVALEIAYRLQRLFGMRVAIIAPNHQSLDNDDGWKNWAAKYNIVLEKATTYAALRGRSNHTNDSWLYHDKKNKKKGFHGTPELKKVCKQGLFLIFDEFHMATRESSTHFACAALVRECLRNSTKCRIGLISLTPGNKLDHYPQIMRLAGLMHSIRVVENVPFTRDYLWEEHGLGEMVRACVARGGSYANLHAEISQGLSMSRAKYLLGEFYNTYLRSRVCFAMPAPEVKHEIKMRNSYLTCFQKDIEPLTDAINRLCQGVSWDGFSVAEKSEWNLGQIGTALRLIERNKLRTIARYIKDRLEDNPDRKFVIGLGSRSTEHFEILKAMINGTGLTCPTETKFLLEKARSDPKNVWSKISPNVLKLILDKIYQPDVDIMNGNTKQNDRVKILRRFQSKKGNSWCLLLSPGVGDKAISLHDTHGNHPRELIIVPDHHHTRLTQMTGRTNRVGIKSDVTVTLVYCKETPKETSILHSMIRKSAVAKNMLAEDQEHMFPGDFEEWIETCK